MCRKKEQTNMKSLIIHMRELAKNRTLALLTAVILPILSPLAFADGSAWSLDPTTSSARFFQGSTANPDSVNSGVARVTGKVMLDTNDLDKSVIDFSIYPADENWGHALSPEGNLPSGYVPDSSDHTLMTFKSERIVTEGNDKFEVIGELTLTHVERSVTMDANEAYAGPVYGDPVVRSETREVTFLLTKDALDLSGSARVNHEDFPELLSAIQDTNWPTVVQNERCQMPSTIGEDYRGPTCTGTVIAATHNDNCQTLTSPGGEGYTGPVCAPPAGDQTTIALDLKLLYGGSEPGTEILSGNAATR
jgi:polyisoprenoid-binding protein YceI